MMSADKTRSLRIENICLLALALRVTWALLVPVEPVSDSFLYNAFAESIVSGKGYAYPAGNLTVFWPVGTSAIYAVLYFFFGISFWPIVALNIIIGVATVWLTYKVAFRYLSESIARIAALLVAIWPILIQFTTILASELIFVFLLLLAIYIWSHERLPLGLRAILWGGCICCATYVRPTALPLLLLMPLTAWFARGELKDIIVQIFLASAIAAIMFMPWVYRNYTQFNHFVLVSANGGINLWMGNNPESGGGYMPLSGPAIENEVLRDKYFGQKAIEYIVSHPLDYLRLAMKRAMITYKAETIGVVWNPGLSRMLDSRSILFLKLISTLYWWMIVIWAVVGTYHLLKQRRLVWHHTLFVVFTFFFLFPILTVGQDRYHMPIAPFLAFFAAYGLLQLFSPVSRLQTVSYQR